MITTDRRRFIALCRSSRALTAGTDSNVWVDPAQAKELMAPQGTAELVSSFTGDEEVEVTRWRVPLVDGSHTFALLTVSSVRLGELAREAS